jgi:DNA repair protein RecO (recombination protein O)
VPGYYATRGYVLRRFNLGEADRIITLITPDHGKLKVVARGVRRMKSKLAGHLELFSHVTLQVAIGKSLDVVTGAQLIEAPPEFDYDQLGAAYLYAQMVDKLLDEDDQPQDTYVLMQMALEDLIANKASNLGELYFKLRLAAILGHQPGLTSCVRCGKSGPDYSYFFEPSLGGIVDEACKLPGATAMSQDAIKLWRAILSLSLPNVRRIGGAEALAAQTLAICNAFYDYNFDRRFTAADTLQG